jgi:methionyl-tRNA formyltransferase
MQLDAGMDTGDLIRRRQVAIDPTDTAGTLTARLAGIGAALLAEALPDVLAGTAVPTPQSEEGITMAAKLSSDEGRLDPGAVPAVVCHRIVRAFNPNPGAWGVVDGQRLKVWDSRPRPELTVAAGEMVVDGDLPVVGTPRGGFELVEVQSAGKSRMPGAVWARGHRGAFRWD